MPPIKTSKTRKYDATSPRRGRLQDGSANPIDVHVGLRVRLRRTLLGITQEKLGEAIGLTFQQIQKYEKGANRISASRLHDLSNVLDVPVSFFFDDLSDNAKSVSPARLANCKTTMMTGETDPMFKQETGDLVKAYYNIIDPRARKQVFLLAKTLGGGV